ncbi:MAG: hypothetical protein WC919_06265 [Candidatus Paceibacterota bacterium]|jgi:hypothetical protein
MTAIPQQLALPTPMVLPIATASATTSAQPHPDSAVLGAARANGIAQWKLTSEEMISQALDRIQKIAKCEEFLIKGWWDEISGAAEKVIKEGSMDIGNILASIEKVRQSVCRATQEPVDQSQVMYELIQCEMLLLIVKDKTRREWLTQTHGQTGVCESMIHIRRPQRQEHSSSISDRTDGSPSDASRAPAQQASREIYAHGKRGGRGGSAQSGRGCSRAPAIDPIFGNPSH